MLSPIDLLFYLGLCSVIAFVFHAKGRANAYEEVAFASNVDTEELMDEVASILEKK